MQVYRRWNAGMRSSPHMFAIKCAHVLKFDSADPGRSLWLCSKIFVLSSLPSDNNKNGSGKWLPIVLHETSYDSNNFQGSLKHIYKYFVPDEPEMSQPTIQSQGDLLPLYNEHGEFPSIVVSFWLYIPT